MEHTLAIALAVMCSQALGGIVWWCWRWARSARPQPTPLALPPSADAPWPELALADISTTRARRSGQPRTTAVMLVHGFMGFGSIGLGPARIHYFRRVARRLERRGVEVHVATLPPLGGTPARALALLEQIARIESDDIVIFAHSLGGLDARWALAHGAADRVRALVTIGTPHRGSPIADAFARGPAARLRGALSRLGVGSDSIDWLTTERLAGFNRDIPDVPGVRYASIVAATTNARRIHPLLRVTHAFLKAHGANDGLVTAASQAWGDVIASPEIDHWAQVGWSGGHDAAALVEHALEAVRALPPAVKQLPATGT